MHSQLLRMYVCITDRLPAIAIKMILLLLLLSVIDLTIGFSRPGKLHIIFICAGRYSYI